MREFNTFFSVDAEALRANVDRPKAYRALDEFKRLALESYIKTLSIDDAIAMAASLETAEGAELFRQNWPKIWDAYLQAFSVPSRPPTAT